MKRLVLLAAAAWAVAGPVRAQLTVFDPQTYSQSVLSAARSLQQIDNQIRMLENQSLSLTNQARNLAQLPYSSLQTLQTNLAAITSLTQQAQRLAFDVQSVQSEFRTNYIITPTATQAALMVQANARWQNSTAAYQQALLLQSGVVGGLPGAAQQTQALLGASQGATGVLQATQAGNQLLALQNQQLASLTALLASQGRSTILDAAANAAARDQADAEFGRFTTTPTYQPYSVEMFH